MIVLGRIACKIGWHAPGERFPYRVWFGVTHQTLCRRCRVPVDCDSQGNWYETDVTPQFQEAWQAVADAAQAPAATTEGQT